MKKKIALLIASLMFAGSLSACDQADIQGSDERFDAAGNSENSKKTQIVTTIFPEYEWVSNIVGEESETVDVTMLLDNGVDLHSYQPSAEDIMKISNCDLFVYVGGESDQWVDDALKEATNRNMKVIDLLDVLGDSVKEEELVEGMQGEEEEDEDSEEEEGPEYDEHVWLSLKNASKIVDVLTDELSEADSENADVYRANADAYKEKLSKLDDEYQSVVSNGKRKTLLFADRFPFRYMTDDYGLDYYAAFVGCSAETEASFETIKFLAEKVNELSLNTVLTIEGADHRIADTVVKSTKTKDQKVISMNSMQSVTSKDIKNGVTYLSVMEDNLETLKEALK